MIGGINSTNAYIIEIDFKGIESTDYRTGLYLGGFLSKSYLGVKWISELILQRKRMLNGTDGRMDVSILEKIKIDAISLGLNASFDISDIEFTLGPYLSYAIRGESTYASISKPFNEANDVSINRYTLELKEDEVNRMELSGKLGVLYYLTNSFQLGISYELSFTPIHSQNGYLRYSQEKEYFSVLRFGLRYRLGELKQ